MKKEITKVMFAGRDVTRFYTSAGTLLGKGEDNPKLRKSLRRSFILYLAPAKFGKIQLPNSSQLINTCPNASPECIATCLNTSGDPTRKQVQYKARIDKTALYFYDKPRFLAMLFKEIVKNANKYSKEEIVIRVNGTSDLPIVEDLTSAGYMQQIPKNVTFYDYTKDPMKAGFWKLPSGHLYAVTFSRSETNTPVAFKVLDKGIPVAVVFRKQLPKKWYGYEVINGDAADDIMVDLMYGKYTELDEKTKEKTGNVYVRKSKGYVLGLTAKGDLKKFVSKKGAKGFVIDCDSYENCQVG